MTYTDGEALAPGLYRIAWTSGGTSLASIGMTSAGRRWIAPTNWTFPAEVFRVKNPDGSGISWRDIKTASPVGPRRRDGEM